MEQYHFRTDDAELILSIQHEQRAQALSKGAAVQALVRDGLAWRRWLREQSALESYERVEHDRDGEQT